MSSNEATAAILPMFEDAHSKAVWAANNITHLDAVLTEYVKTGVKSILFEPEDGEEFRRYLAWAGVLPPSLVTLRVGDIVRCLRATLDYTISAIYRHRSLPENHAYFPMGDNRTGLESTLKGEIQKRGLEKLTPFFLDEVNATEVGNIALWQLNKIDRAVKHRSLNIITTIVLLPEPDFFILESNFVSQGNRIGLMPGQQVNRRFPLMANLKDHAYAEPTLEITFDQSELLAGHHVLPTLVNFYKVVIETIKKTQQAYIAAYGVGP